MVRVRAAGTWWLQHRCIGTSTMRSGKRTTRLEYRSCWCHRALRASSFVAVLLPLRLRSSSSGLPFSSDSMARFGITRSNAHINDIPCVDPCLLLLPWLLFLSRYVLFFSFFMLSSFGEYLAPSYSGIRQVPLPFPLAISLSHSLSESPALETQTCTKKNRRATGAGPYRWKGDACIAYSQEYTIVYPTDRIYIRPRAS